MSIMLILAPGVAPILILFFFPIIVAGNILRFVIDGPMRVAWIIVIAIIVANHAGADYARLTDFDDHYDGYSIQPFFYLFHSLLCIEARGGGYFYLLLGDHS